jgi:hypothetical protein
MMPDMSGPVISRLLKKHRPEMRVMLMSGYPASDILLNVGWHFSPKPFLPARYETGASPVIPETAPSLWDLLSGVQLWSADVRLLRPVLIFDQFEEVFTRRDQEFRGTFAREVGELLRGRLAQDSSSRQQPPPEVKVIIRLREEYLGKLEELTGTIPELFRERLRLPPLTVEEGLEGVVHGYYLGELDKLTDRTIRRRAVRMFQEGLLDPAGKRLMLEEGEIEREYGLGPAVLSGLVESHLLRREPSSFRSKRPTAALDLEMPCEVMRPLRSSWRGYGWSPRN